jgi:hypothetical protein
LARRNQKNHKCRNKKPEPQTYFFHFSPPFVFNKAGVDCLKWDNNISAGSSLQSNIQACHECQDKIM